MLMCTQMFPNGGKDALGAQQKGNRRVLANFKIPKFQFNFIASHLLFKTNISGSIKPNSGSCTVRNLKSWIIQYSVGTKYRYYQDTKIARAFSISFDVIGIQLEAKSTPIIDAMNTQIELLLVGYDYLILIIINQSFFRVNTNFYYHFKLM